MRQLFFSGEEIEVKKLSVRGLLPETDYYMTYDGSTTMPACQETVTWLILNKPIYITKQQVLVWHLTNPRLPDCTLCCHTLLLSRSGSYFTAYFGRD